jgi:hypothetical protein
MKTAVVSAGTIVPDRRFERSLSAYIAIENDSQ